MTDLIKTKDFSFFVKDNKLVFEGDVSITGSKDKKVTEMKPLLYNGNNLDENDWQYCFAFNMAKNDEIRALHDKYQLFDGITLLNKGTVNGECRKNSGHYHLICEGHNVPTYEIYECIYGKAAIVLQESHDFFDKDYYKVDSFRLVILEEGQKVIIPAYCAHCVINIGDDYMAFYNFSGMSKVDYKPIESHHGFAYYLLKNKDMFTLVPNKAYKDLPLPEIIEPKEDKTLGIDFSKSLYQTFLETPEIFDYLINPNDYEERVSNLLR